MAGEYHSGGEIEGKVDVFGVSEGIRAVDAGRDPGDEKGDEKEKRNASVEESIGVFFAERGRSGDGGDAEYCWSGRSPRHISSLIELADFDVNRISVVILVSMALAFINLANLKIGN